jgi:hypothetical protein
MASFRTIAPRRSRAAPPARVHSWAPGPNWLRFARLALPNWVRLYSRPAPAEAAGHRLPESTSQNPQSAIEKLGSFLQPPTGYRLPPTVSWVRFARFALVPRPWGARPARRRREIGFVLHGWLRPIGFVCTTGPRRPRRWAAGFLNPQAKIRNSQSRNWVRFAPSLPGVLPPARAHSWAPGPNWVRFYRRLPPTDYRLLTTAFWLCSCECPGRKEVENPQIMQIRPARPPAGTKRS